MKKYLIIIFLLSVSIVKAEYFLNFNIYKVDLSEYPTVKIIGGAYIEEFYDGLFVTGRHLDIYENGDMIDFDIDIIPYNNKIKIFSLTYKSNLPKTSIRKYLFKFDNHGIHNGSDGQFIIYNNGNIKHPNNGYDWLETDSLEDGEILESVKEYLKNPKKGKYPEASLAKLTREKLQNYSKKELKLMRNEIFARNGHIFIPGGALDKYFSSKIWYKRKKILNLNELTEIERHNIHIIQELER